MLESIVDIQLSGVLAQTINVDVNDLATASYRISTNTSSAITGNKTIAFTGSPVNNVTVLEFMNEGGINTSGASKLVIGGYTVPDIFAQKKCMFKFQYSNSSWIPYIFISDEQSGFVVGSSIVDNSVPAIKLQNDIAGAGMTRNISGGVTPNLEATQPSLQISSSELGVKIDPSRAITKNVNGIGVNLQTSNPTLQIAANQVGVKFPADGGLEATTDGLEVKLDPNGDLVKTNDGLKLGNFVKMKQVVVPLSSAEILALNTTPVVLIPASANPKIAYFPVDVWMKKTGGSTPYTTNTDVSVYIGTGNSFFNLDVLGTNTNLLYALAKTETTSEAGEAVYLHSPSGNPVVGNTTWDIIVNYFEYEI